MNAEYRSVPVAKVTDNPWLSASRWIMLILLVSTVTWRSSSIYGGGLDIVVVAKACLGLLAVGLAWIARMSTPRPRPMGNTFVWLLIAYATISTFGAWTAGRLAVSGVLSVRLLLVGLTLILLVKTFPAKVLWADLMAAMTVVALVAAVSGIPSLFAEGRLSGGVPGMHSNELALLCTLTVIGGIHRLLLGRTNPLGLAVLSLLFVALLGTGSRTALLTVVLAVLVMLPQARKISPILSIFTLACIPATIFVLLGTGFLESFFVREGEGDATTLNSRSIAWSAALHYPPDDWVRWLGSGLGTKEIPVAGQYWDKQVLDSSWVSALVQAGWFGVLIMLVWTLVVIAMTFRMKREDRMLAQGLLLALVTRSILESGLMDSSPAFLVFAFIALVADTGPREPRFPRRATDDNMSSHLPERSIA